MVGGGERYPLNVARGLLAADPDLHVDLIGVGHPPRVECVEPRLDVHVLDVTLRGVDPLDDVSAALPDVLAPADIVHVHQAFTRSSQVAILVAKLLGKALVVTDHGAMTNRVDDAVQYTGLVDLFVFQSRFAAAQIPAARRSIIIPGGVDTRFFRPPVEPVKRKHVLFVGRLLPHKGVDRLITALPADVPLVIVGRPYAPDYARYVRALGATKDITFVEDADDLAVRALYREALATVLPSVHRDAWGGIYQAPELMGFTGLESMACGTPAIVSSAGALPEFVRDRRTGFVFESLGELRARIEALASGAVDADALGAAGRAMVEEEYAVTVVGERLRNAYAELLSNQLACAS